MSHACTALVGAMTAMRIQSGMMPSVNLAWMTTSPMSGTAPASLLATKDTTTTLTETHVMPAAVGAITASGTATLTMRNASGAQMATSTTGTTMSVWRAVGKDSSSMRSPSTVSTALMGAAAATWTTNSIRSSALTAGQATSLTIGPMGSGTRTTPPTTMGPPWLMGPLTTMGARLIGTSPRGRTGQCPTGTMRWVTATTLSVQTTSSTTSTPRESARTALRVVTTATSGMTGSSTTTSSGARAAMRTTTRIPGDGASPYARRASTTTTTGRGARGVRTPAPTASTT
mmetsp:Transcript_9388/g.8871  ORF Transcript_9388/g.8871 Transcript_9388/m.8871 type:complete len:287 (+) Transcript_9388:1613-2473(+)